VCSTLRKHYSREGVACVSVEQVAVGKQMEKAGIKVEERKLIPVLRANDKRSLQGEVNHQRSSQIKIVTHVTPRSTRCFVVLQTFFLAPFPLSSRGKMC
jgi:hypothetical protein